MSLKCVDQASEDVSSYFTSKFQTLFKKSDEISKYVSNHIDTWNRQSKRNIQVNFPYFEYESLLDEWKNRVNSKDYSIESMKGFTCEYLSFCKAVKAPINENFWMKQFDKSKVATPKYKQGKNDLSVDAKLLLQEWQKTMDKAHAEWEMGQLELLRKKLLKELEETLDIFQQLHDQLQQIGLDFGILFDLSKGNLSEQDIQQFKRWSTYISENQGIKDLCDLLGRLRQIELSEKIEMINVTKAVDTPQPDVNSNEEIIGIRLGKEIEYALPSELALLSDAESSLLFDLKFIESRLMCFEMQGAQSVIEYHNFEEEAHTKEEEKKGPMIVCIDTSGSMQGTPETIAKAIVLYMVSKAKSEKRPCYLINFSTSIQVLDFGESMSMKALISFLKMSFHGGTDVAPALKHALQIMKEENYLKSDLVVISDFIMGSLPTDLMKNIELQRESGSKFYSLVVGQSFLSQRMKTLFDQEWVFNPQTSQIHELVNFNNNID